jgi:DNA (cytosine-5)-methyltransferase 1
MQQIRVLDLFSGGGGSSYGARSAGAEIVAGVDAWSMASQTYARNFPGAQALNARLEGEGVSEAVRALGPIDLLLASPECTNHTCARGARPRSEDSKMTAWQVLHHAKVLKPRWIVVENVVQMRSWDRFREFEMELLKQGYLVWPRVIDASDYGVPQSRRRLFLICTREDKAFDIQPPEGVKRKVAQDILDPAGTWRVTPLYRPGRAQATLERAERGFAALGRRQPFLVVYYGSDAAGGWQTLDRPIRTLTTLDRFALVQPGPNGHTMRMLQLPELKRAMGFGADFDLSLGTRREGVKLLGNGVCPPVMEHIVLALTGRASGRARVLRPLTLVPPIAASA